MENPIQLKDDWEPGYKLKPCIAEILRTDYCPKGLIMLVDKIVLVTMANTEDNQAYRLYVSDGEKNIQAVLTPLMHRFVWTGEIREGSYIMLDKYKLALGKKLIGTGHVAYLAIADVHTVGLRRKFAQDRTFDNHGLLTEVPDGEQLPPKRCKLDEGPLTMRETYAVFKDPAADDNPLGFVAKFDALADEQATKEHSKSTTPTAKHIDKRKRQTLSSPLGERSPNAGLVPDASKAVPSTMRKTVMLRKTSTPDHVPESITFYNKHVTAHQKRCDQPCVVHGKWCSCKVCRPGEKENSSETSEAVDLINPATTQLQAPTTTTTTTKTPSLKPTTSVSQQALLALERGTPLKRIRSPLELYRLASMTGNRKNQNRRGDYFATISWIDNKTIKRFCMPLKRDLRIVDPSTEKQVLLSVFVDPVNFTPAVGTIALFRNLRTHEWDGGSLNAYEKDCKGYDWFVPFPVGVSGCDVEGMTKWWDEKQEGEREKRRIEGKVKEGMMGGEVKMAPVCHDRCVIRSDRQMADDLDDLGLLADINDIEDDGDDKL